MSGWGTHLALVNFAFVVLANNKNAVLEDKRLEITIAKDFLNCSVTRHMTTTGPVVEIIENTFIFLDCKASAKN